MKLWSKVLQIFLLFSLYFSSLNLKYLKLTKMDITRFAMKLFIYSLGPTLAIYIVYMYLAKSLETPLMPAMFIIGSLAKDLISEA